MLYIEASSQYSVQRTDTSGFSSDTVPYEICIYKVKRYYNKCQDLKYNKKANCSAL